MTQLNEYQRRAVEKSLKADKFFLIHGPPGTGKTTTLVECIHEHVKRGFKVLATADSNIATDNLLERLVERGISAVRIGNPVKVLDSVREHTLDFLLERDSHFKKAKEIYEEIERLKEEQRKFTAPQPRYRRGLSNDDILKYAKTGTYVRGVHPKVLRSMAKWIKLQEKIQKLYEEAKKEEMEAVKRILSQADVVCSTNSTAGSEVLEGFSFDLVVIDEATQSTEPSCLIPLVKGQKFIMAGDHKQLPPTILSSQAKEQLSYTLFERLIDLYGEKNYEMLRIQYRMNEKIMKFSSQEFYEGKLIAHESVARRVLSLDRNKLSKLPNPFREILFPQNVIVFWNTRGREERREGETSYYNLQEAERVRELVFILLDMNIPPSSIGVISPYEGQVRLIEELLERCPVEVKTVDGFQGREKEIIILSLVRSNERGDIGFLKDYRRLNVAITRARSKLIILGNQETLSRDAVYRKLMDYIRWEGLYI